MITAPKDYILKYALPFERNLVNSVNFYPEKVPGHSIACGAPV
jgi:hypothetical protein